MGSCCTETRPLLLLLLLGICCPTLCIWDAEHVDESFHFALEALRMLLEVREGFEECAHLHWWNVNASRSRAPACHGFNCFTRLFYWRSHLEGHADCFGLRLGSLSIRAGCFCCGWLRSPASSDTAQSTLWNITNLFGVEVLCVPGVEIGDTPPTLFSPSPQVALHASVPK